MPAQDDLVTAADGTKYTQAQLDSLRQTEDFVTASLLIAQPGGALYSTMGHAAIRMQCPVFDLDYVFSYESEDQTEKVLSFLMGRLHMGLFPIPLDEYLETYAVDNREVRSYKINLTPQMKQELWRVLDDHVSVGGNLPYDYVKRGCAISCLHLLNEVLGEGRIRYAEWPEKYYRLNRRELAAEIMCPYPWSKFVIVTLVGAEYDHDCSMQEKLIIPTDLADVWSRATLDGKPLLEAPTILLPGAMKPKKVWFTPMLLAILLLLLTIINCYWQSKYIDWIFVWGQAFAGVFFVYLMLFSGLPCTNWYWVFIMYNPLPLLFWKWRAKWAIIYAIVLFAWGVGMQCYPHMLVEPAHIVLDVAFICMLLRQQDWPSLSRVKQA